jgi:hypothetical protein
MAKCSLLVSKSVGRCILVWRRWAGVTGGGGGSGDTAKTLTAVRALTAAGTRSAAAARVRSVRNRLQFALLACYLVLQNIFYSVRYKKYRYSERIYSTGQCCGSGIRCFFTPRIRDGAMVGSGSGISKQNW